MAEERKAMVERDLQRNPDTVAVVTLAGPSTTPLISRFVTAFKAIFCLTNSRSSSAEYHSTRWERLLQQRSEFGSELEFEIEASKDYWSELAISLSVGEQAAAEKNLQTFRSLQKQWPCGFFREVGDGEMVVGQKIAEGGQAEIFEARFTEGFPDAQVHIDYILKVFKQGSSLQALQQQC
jgi:hypothetical protein